MRAWLAVLAACGGSAPPPAPLVNQAPHAPVDPSPGGDEIAFERDECLDQTCPSYRAVIHRDGRVEWHGLTNVRVVGKAVGTVEPRALDKLRIAFDLAKFDERNDDATLGHTDTITVCADGVDYTITRARHKITHHSCLKDEGLAALERLLDDTVAPWM